jgi:hypothetical protein
MLFGATLHGSMYVLAETLRGKGKEGKHTKSKRETKLRIFPGGTAGAKSPSARKT